MTIPVPPKAPREQIWLIGDSLAVGLLPALKKLAAASGADLRGAPVGGTRVEHWTSSAIYLKNIDDALAWPATHFLISLGTNDAAKKQLPNIGPLIDHVRSKGSRVSWIGAPQIPFEFAPMTLAYIKKQCDYLGAAYLDSRTATFEHAPGDKVHASPKGYATWAAWLWPRIKPNLVTSGSSLGVVGWTLLGIGATALAGWGAFTLASRINS